MVAGFWYNNDGLPLQYGTQKAIPEMGGDYLAYGTTRELETYISLATTTFGNPTTGNVQVPALPSSFSGTSTPIAAGIQGLTTFFPMQTTAPITAATSGNGLLLNAQQVWIDQVELTTLVAANAGTGGATGLTGIGFVVSNSTVTPSVFVQATPNAGVQLVGAITNAEMAAGSTWVWRANAAANGTYQYQTAPGAFPVAGSWLGNVPLLTNAITFSQEASPSNPTGLPDRAWISATAAGGTYSGTTAAGLLKLRVRYNIYGTIAQ